MEIKSSSENCVEVEVIFPILITSSFISEEQANRIKMTIAANNIFFIILTYYLIQIFIWRAPIHVEGYCKNCSNSDFTKYER